MNMQKRSEEKSKTLHKEIAKTLRKNPKLWNSDRKISNPNENMEFTLSITEERFAKLKEMATRLNISPEDLVRISIDDLLSRPGKDFQSAVGSVLYKNNELYRRLA